MSSSVEIGTLDVPVGLDVLPLLSFDVPVGLDALPLLSSWDADLELCSESFILGSLCRWDLIARV